MGVNIIHLIIKLLLYRVHRAEQQQDMNKIKAKDTEILEIVKYKMKQHSNNKLSLIFRSDH